VSDRDRVVAYLDEALMEDFERWVSEHYGKTEYNTSKALRLAVRELINGHAGDGGTDDIEAVHDKLDEVLDLVREQSGTHTHKQSAVSDIDKVIARVETEGTPMPESRLEQIIVETRGLDVGDKRTLRRWKRRIRHSQRLHQLPDYDDIDDPVEWTENLTQWVIAVENAPQHMADNLVEAHGYTDAEYENVCSIEHPRFENDDVSEDCGAQFVHTASSTSDMSENCGAKLSTQDEAEVDEQLDALDESEAAED